MATYFVHIQCEIDFSLSVVDYTFPDGFHIKPGFKFDLKAGASFWQGFGEVATHIHAEYYDKAYPINAGQGDTCEDSEASPINTLADCQQVATATGRRWKGSHAHENWAPLGCFLFDGDCGNYGLWYARNPEPAVSTHFPLVAFSLLARAHESPI